MIQKQRGIYKRKDGRYEVRFIKGRDENGRAKYGSKYARSYQEALDKLEKTRPTYRKETNHKMQQTIPTVIKQYLESIRGQIKASTFGTYHTQLEKHITPYFSETKCADFSPSIVQEFVDVQIISGLSVKSVEGTLVLLRKGLDDVFPSAYAVELPKYIVSGLEILSHDEQKRLETAAKNSDAIDHVGTMLCLYTGIKPGELCGLMWSDIDFDKKLLYVRRTAQRISTPDGDTKTTATFLPVNHSAQRVIPLAGFLVELLGEYQEQSVGEFLISKDGNPIEVRNMQSRFAKLLQKAGIRPLPFQVSRDTFAARALSKGFDLKSLGEILGHSSLQMTIKKYGKLLELDEYRHLDIEALAENFHG